MTITREQFIRGFNALKAHQVNQRAVEDAARNAGFEGFDLGHSPLATELEQQLVERCRDKEDDQGPWPGDSAGEGDISMALHYPGVPVYDEQDNLLPPHPTTAEGLWAMWERTKTGPFRPNGPVGGPNVVSFKDRRG